MRSFTRSAVAALLLAVPVAAQLVVPSLGDALAGHLLFAVTQLTGWALLVSVCRGLAPALPSRAGRVGRRLLVAGAAAEAGFALAYGTLVVIGADEGAAFVLFFLGFLLLAVGGLTAGIAATRSGSRHLGGALVTVAVLGLMANLVGDTGWHELFLLTHYLGWAVVGRFAPVSEERGMPSGHGAREHRAVAPVWHA